SCGGWGRGRAGGEEVAGAPPGGGPPRLPAHPAVDQLPGALRAEGAAALFEEPPHVRRSRPLDLALVAPDRRRGLAPRVGGEPDRPLLRGLVVLPIEVKRPERPPPAGVVPPGQPLYRA